MLPSFLAVTTHNKTLPAKCRQTKPKQHKQLRNVCELQNVALNNHVPLNFMLLQLCFALNTAVSWLADELLPKQESVLWS